MEEKQDAIIAAAEGLFIRFGFRKTTMEEIAKAAGIGKATLYYYFKSKEEIFVGMIDRETRSGVSVITAAVNSATTPQDQLRAFVLAQAGVMKAKLDYYAILREELVDLLPLVKCRQEQMRAQGKYIVRKILEDGLTAQAFGLNDPDLMANLILTLTQDFSIRVIIEENRATWKDDMARFLNLLLDGLNVRNETKGEEQV